MSQTQKQGDASSSGKEPQGLKTRDDPKLKALADSARVQLMAEDPYITVCGVCFVLGCPCSPRVMMRAFERAAKCSELERGTLSSVTWEVKF